MLASEWKAHGSYFDFDGRPVFHREDGDGPTVVCLHGFPTASWIWSRVWPDLTSSFRVVAPDLVGYGYSSKRPEQFYTTFDQADLVEDLLRELNIHRTHLVGQGFGNTVIQELLARRVSGRHRFDIESVCLLNGGFFPDLTGPLPGQRALLGRFARLATRMISEKRFSAALRQLFGPRAPASRVVLEELWHLFDGGDGRGVVRKLLGFVSERERFHDRWTRAVIDCDVPLRLIVGREDPVCGATTVARYRSLVPFADVTELPGVGHFPQFEAPADVMGSYLEFIQSQPKKTTHRVLRTVFPDDAPPPEGERAMSVQRIDDGFLVDDPETDEGAIPVRLGSASLFLDLEIRPDRQAPHGNKGGRRELRFETPLVTIGPARHARDGGGLGRDRLLLIDDDRLSDARSVIGKLVPLADLPIVENEEAMARFPGSRGCALFKHVPARVGEGERVEVEIGLREPYFSKAFDPAIEGHLVEVAVEGVAEGLTSGTTLGGGRDLLLDSEGHAVLWISDCVVRARALRDRRGRPEAPQGWS